MRGRPGLDGPSAWPLKCSWLRRVRAGRDVERRRWWLDTIFRVSVWRWYVKTAFPKPKKPKRAQATVGGITHRLVWNDRNAGFRFRCSCGWVDPKLRWTENNAIQAGNSHVRSARWNASRSASAARRSALAPAPSPARRVRSSAGKSSPAPTPAPADSVASKIQFAEQQLKELEETVRRMELHPTTKATLESALPGYRDQIEQLKRTIAALHIRGPGPH